MATVLERFNHLGLASSNPVLMKVGLHVSTVLHNENIGTQIQVKKVSQKEGDHTFFVNNYPDEWTERVDRIILSFVENGMQNG